MCESWRHTWMRITHVNKYTCILLYICMYMYVSVLLWFICSILMPLSAWEEGLSNVQKYLMGNRVVWGCVFPTRTLWTPKAKETFKSRAVRPQIASESCEMTLHYVFRFDFANVFVKSQSWCTFLKTFSLHTNAQTKTRLHWRVLTHRQALSLSLTHTHTISQSPGQHTSSHSPSYESPDGSCKRCQPVRLSNSCPWHWHFIFGCTISSRNFGSLAEHGIFISLSILVIQLHKSFDSFGFGSAVSTCILISCVLEAIVTELRACRCLIGELVAAWPVRVDLLI